MTKKQSDETQIAVIAEKIGNIEKLFEQFKESFDKLNDKLEKEYVQQRTLDSTNARFDESLKTANEKISMLWKLAVTLGGLVVIPFLGNIINFFIKK